MKPDLTLVPCPEGEIDRMIESRQWWIFIGNQRLIDSLEAIARKKFNCPPFPTFLGPAPEKFKRFMSEGIAAITFCKKSDLPLPQLNEALKRSGCPPSKTPPSEEQDILLLFTAKEWKS